MRDNLLEKRLEFRDENLFEELKKLCQYYRDRHRSEIRIGEIAKDYASAALKLHLHFLRYGACVEVGRKWNSDRACEDRLGIGCHPNATVRVDGKLDVDIIADCQENGPMLIDVVQVLKNGEGVLKTKFIRSEARLKTLDDCHHVFGNSLRMVGAPICPSLGGCGDGELPIHAVMTAVVNSDQPTDQIVEGRPHVVNAVPDNRSDSNRRTGVKCVVDDPRRVIRRIGFNIGFVFYEFDEILDFRLEDVKVFLGPGDLSIKTFHPQE